ncbi:MAG TPA: glycosyltransferase family 2 protein [Gemmatimonadota bacterium]|nr:glycosyltransferase family 2 protein [Gemmatimonadota bacterium]
MIYFLIPAYDEEDTIGLLLYKIRDVMRDIRREYLAIVLDDGSTDGTAEAAEAYRRFLPVKVLRHAENRGLGPSLDRLVREAVRLSQYPERDIAVVIEADFTQSPDSVPAMVKEIEAGADIAIGARTHPESQIEDFPGHRRLGGRIVTTVLRAIMPLPGVTDYTSSFRAYRIGTLKRAVAGFQEGLIGSPDGSANVELLLRLGRFHPTFAEVPVHYRFDVRPRASRHRLGREIRGGLSLTGRVDRVAAPPA